MSHTQTIDSITKESLNRFNVKFYNVDLVKEIVDEFQKNYLEKKQNGLLSRQRIFPRTPMGQAIRESRAANKSSSRSKNLIKPRLINKDNQHDILNDLQKISYVNGNRVVILSVEKAKKLSRMVEIILTGGFTAGDDQLNYVDVEPKTPKVLKLSPEEVQKLRDEVREMAHKGRPKEGIPLYRGLRGGDGDAVSFFKKHYAPYIEPGQEVIFAPELHAIDDALLAALRNDCRSPSNPMPLGRVQERTDARIEGRFSDGESLKHSVRKGLIRRRAILEEVEA